MNQDNQFNQKNHELNYDDMVEKVIEEINTLYASELMFGTRFRNHWEEIAYRSQVEKSQCSATVLNLCRTVVGKLPNKLVRNFWLLLDVKGKWYFANDYPEDDVKAKKPRIDDMRESVAEELCKRVDQAAANYDLTAYIVDDLPVSNEVENVLASDKLDYDYYDCLDQIIEEIRRIPKTSLESGTHSPYEDVWEEYAAYVQGIDSCFMQEQEHSVEEICYRLVERLTQSNLHMIWKEIEAAFGWCDEGSEQEISEMQKSVAENLIKSVFEIAVDYDFTWEEDDEVDINDETNNGFILKKPDYEAIKVAINVLRLFLSQGNLSARHIVALGKALYAMERMPDVTPGICCDFGISYQKADAKRSYIRYISFLISDSEFSITTGTRACGQTSGGDRIGLRWRIPIGWFPVRSLGRELYALEDEIRQCLEQGAEITVEKLSEEIDMEDEKM